MSMGSMIYLLASDVGRNQRRRRHRRENVLFGRGWDFWHVIAHEGTGLGLGVADAVGQTSHGVAIGQIAVDFLLFRRGFGVVGRGGGDQRRRFR